MTRKPKFSRRALQTIAEIVNGQHCAPEVEVGPANRKHIGEAIEFEGWENGGGEPCAVIFLRYKKVAK